MPELPEIETVKLQLQKYLVDKRIIALEKLHPKSVIGKVEQVVGKRVEKVDRKGKMLIIDLEDGIHLAIHFKMSGQLIYDKSQNSEFNDQKRIRIVGGHPTSDWIGQLPSKHTRAIFTFNDQSKLYFNDQRIFGWIKILDDKFFQELKFLQDLGKEPWDMTDKEFFQKIYKRNKPIKLLIMDQNIISGVGNIYANDGLWEAKIHPAKKAKDLNLEESKTLKTGLIKVLKEGIKYGGATAPDNKYVNLEGLGGKYQEYFRTYSREGQKCLRNDGGVIKKMTLGGRGTYFCPNCQQ